MKFNFFRTTFLSFFATSSIFAQQDGYWDKERITDKQIVVSARDKIIIKSEDFPVGTTEIVYRITLLDENQEMASSLVSVLKAIPDPTGISQGSAGAVLLLSKISGDDKCNYALFNAEKFAKEYQKTGNLDKACFVQNNPINKEAKVVSLGKTTCLKINSENIYFGFESKNWIMNQKIILEIVPWVDNKLARGWNAINKQVTLNQCKLSETAKKLPNSDDFCVCRLEKLQEKYKFFEYENLISTEKNSALKTIENACLKQTGDIVTVDNAVRNEAELLAKNQKYDQAIAKLSSEIVKKGNAIATDYNNLGTYYLLTKQYQKALENIKKAELLDDSELQIKLNLAHVYMFTDAIKLAKNIHEKYKNQNINATQTWIEKTKSDFDLFQKTGLPDENFNKILRVLD